MLRKDHISVLISILVILGLLALVPGVMAKPSDDKCSRGSQASLSPEVGERERLSEASSPNWRGEYYNNECLSGDPALVRDDPEINFDWGTGSPGGGLGADHFSVRWTRDIDFIEGNYRFYTTTDDGVRLWVDSVLIIDEWHVQLPTVHSGDIYLSAGSHRVKMEYYEAKGSAVARLTWERAEFFPNWKGEYFNNQYLSGAPTFVRDDCKIDFDWGTGSPGGGLGTDHFSVRWTKPSYYNATGYHTFYATTDDGVRVWVNDKLIIDQWHDQAPTTHTATIYLCPGVYVIKMEYYENMGGAMARLHREFSPTPPPVTPTPPCVTPTPLPCPLTPAPTAVPPTPMPTLCPLTPAPTPSAVAPTPTPTPCPVTPAPQAVIVDDLDAGFTRGGSWTGWRGVAYGYGGHMFWTWNNARVAYNYNWARWIPNLPSPGHYEVFAYIPGVCATTTQARYWIYHAGSYHLRRVNQSTYYNQWVSLGTYYFTADGTEYVSLADVTYEWYLSRLIGFDAVKFVYYGS